ARGADVRVRDALRRSPLSHAVQKSDPELVKDLLAHGADPTEFDGRGTAPLNYAIYWHAYNLESKSPTIVELLLAQPQVNINAPCQTNGETPLETAAYAGDEMLVNVFLSHGADSTKVDLSRVNHKKLEQLLAAANRKRVGATKQTGGNPPVELPKLKELP